MNNDVHAPSGLIPILATPFDEQGSLDERSLNQLTTFQVEAGADGVAIFGMASEAFTLSTVERRDIARIVSRALTGTGLQLIAGIAATSIRGAIEQLASAADDGITTVMTMPPFMVKPNASQVFEFYASLGSAAVSRGVQVMVQDAPGTTGVTLDVDTLVAIADLPGVTSVKIEAPPTVPKIHSVTNRLTATEFAVLGGQNSQFVLEEYSSGAVGTMPACEFTDLLAPIVREWVGGDVSWARSAFARLLPLLVWGLQPGLAWSVHKEVLVARGLIAHATVRSPARELSPEGRSLLSALLREMELIAPSSEVRA